MFYDVLRVFRSLVGQGTYTQSTYGSNPQVRHKDEWDYPRFAGISSRHAVVVEKDGPFSVPLSFRA
jgi:hypothetical protein